MNSLRGEQTLNGKFSWEYSGIDYAVVSFQTALKYSKKFWLFEVVKVDCPVYTILL